MLCYGCVLATGNVTLHIIQSIRANNIIDHTPWYGGERGSTELHGYGQEISLVQQVLLHSGRNVTGMPKLMIHDKAQKDFQKLSTHARV